MGTFVFHWKDWPQGVVLEIESYLRWRSPFFKLKSEETGGGIEGVSGGSAGDVVAGRFERRLELGHTAPDVYKVNVEVAFPTRTRWSH